MGVQQFRRKPHPADDEDQIAARYEPGEPMADLLAVARLGHYQAEVAEVPLKSGTVLLVRYMSFPDDHAPSAEFVIVKAGDWLAYSDGNDHLYDATAGNWAQFYDEVPR